MYSRHFLILSYEMMHERHEVLREIASEGGWRKRIIDSAREDSGHGNVLPMVLRFISAGILKVIPPVGRGFRRALAAQIILDSKATNW